MDTKVTLSKIKTSAKKNFEEVKQLPMEPTTDDLVPSPSLVQ